jgi:hypothetical protein
VAGPARGYPQRVREVFAYYRVGRMLCDPAKWQTEIEHWAEEFGDEIVVIFDTNQPTRMWRACDRFSTALAEGAYSHDGSSVLSAHVLAMHRRKVRVRDDDDDGRTKFVFVKGPDRSQDRRRDRCRARPRGGATMPADMDYDVLQSVW